MHIAPTLYWRWRGKVRLTSNSYPLTLWPKSSVLQYWYGLGISIALYPQQSTYRHLLSWSISAISYLVGSYSTAKLISTSWLHYRPSAMVWPGQLSNTSLLWALHDKSKSDPSKSSGWRVSRYRYFVYVMMGSFAWYWIPGVLWQGLSVFAFVTCVYFPTPLQKIGFSWSF